MLDICIVTYNTATRDLERLQAEIKMHTAMEHEVHVLDNTGNMLNIAQARNVAAIQGGRNFIAFLNPDVHLEGGWAMSMMADLEMRPSAGCVVPRMLAAGTEAYPDDDFKHRLTFFAVLMRRATWKALHGFDERFRYLGIDADFRKRIGVVQRLDTVVALNVAMVHGRGEVIRKGAMNGGMDFAEERVHQRSIENSINDLSIPYWHDLTSEARGDVRNGLRYSMKRGASR